MAAASAAVWPLVCGPRRAGRVLAVTPCAVYLELPGAGVLGLLSSRAVRVPVGVVVGEREFEVVSRARRGDVADAGEYAVRVGQARLQVARWWRSAVPAVAGLREVPAERLGGLLRRLPLALELRAPVRALGAALRSHEEPPVRSLLGLGPGLTPAGDDVLCGALAALAAAGPPAAAHRSRLAAAVIADAGRTTVLSAALLRAAADGHCVPPLVTLLRSLPGDPARLERAVAEIARVGHSSGAALAVGAVLAVAAVPQVAS